MLMNVPHPQLMNAQRIAYAQTLMVHTHAFVTVVILTKVQPVPGREPFAGVYYVT